MKLRQYLYCLVGLSASGKSTIGKKLAEENNAVIISSDAIRGEICEDGVADQSKNEEVFRIFHKRIKDNLTNGVNVIADATNVTLKARRSLLENVAKVDCYKIAYIVPKPVEQCIRDNVGREYPVPDGVIEKQMNRFQIPFKEEGFDEIIIHQFNTVINEKFMENCLHMMNGFNQKNPHHTMDLNSHCDYVFRQFLKYQYLRQYNIAARLHDIGKVFTQTFDDEGVAHYYEHENVGCYYLLSNIDSILFITNLMENEFLDMLFLINYHMLPMSWNEKKWKRRFGEEKYMLLMDFNRCDKAR